MRAIQERQWETGLVKVNELVQPEKGRVPQAVRSASQTYA
jgi:hypothetical protein